MSLSSSVSVSKLANKVSFPLLLVGSNKKEILTKLKSLGVNIFDWQSESLEENIVNNLEVSQGRLGLLIINKKQKKSSSPGFFQKNIKAIARDCFCEWIHFLKGENKYSIIALNSISAEATEGLGIGVALSSYLYRSDQKYRVEVDLDEKAFKKGVVLGDAVNTARWLVDSPANKINPETYKNLIQDHFKKEPKFDVKVLNRAQLVKGGYGLISAVGQGSETGPFIVHVSYKGSTKKESIAIVGKGITFDTGGLDLKPSKFMRLMKKDMGGSASLFGIASWVKATKPKENFDFIFAIAENSVSKESVRPGDIMKAKNGLTVEMHNTDAEGRLALASGFNYLSSLNKKFSYCMNIATLTGAIKVGLGDRVAGLFSNDTKFGTSLAKAGEEAGDELWLMPMPYWTKEGLETSNVADVVNARDGYGGAITAAEFLKLFIPKDTPWCHLDTFAWTDSKRDAFTSKGATGQAVQAVCKWIEDRS